MALPVAQLGYMPNLNVPTSRQIIQKQDPWAELAQAVLSQAAGQVVSNVMQPDYTSELSASDPAQVTATMPTDTQGGTQEVALRDQDSPWWMRAVQGPKTNREQFNAEQGRRAVAAEGQSNREAQAERDRVGNIVTIAGQKSQEETARRGQDISQSQGTAQNALDYARMLQEGRLTERGQNLQHEGSIPAQTSAQADLLRANQAGGPAAAAETAAVQVFKAYIDYVQKYAEQAVINNVLDQAMIKEGRTPPARQPMLSQEQFFQQYNSGRPTFGLPQFQGQGQ